MMSERPFSPLFIGAMVATLGIERCFQQVRPFSPLFIGAMVATLLESEAVKTEEMLSVPFSSGQWLLLEKLLLKT